MRYSGGRCQDVVEQTGLDLKISDIYLDEILIVVSTKNGLKTIQGGCVNRLHNKNQIHKLSFERE